MRKISILLVSLLILVSCVSTPSPEFNADIQVINDDELGEFWISAQETVEFVTQRNERPPSDCGYVVYEYVIDSNGRVFNVEITDSEPEGDWDWAAVKQLSLLKFNPAASNPGRIPVKVKGKVEFRTKGQECEL